MATQAQAIITAATATSLANDAGRTDLANDASELLAVLNRKIKQLYALAGMPKEFGGMGSGDFFATSAAVVLAASPVALPAAAFRHVIEDATGRRVTVVPRADLIDGVAEMPPAVIIEQQKIISAARPEDPVPGATLTVHYTPLPALTSVTDYIGATTPADATTTSWPDWVGDPFLVAVLARYLAVKAGDRDADEMAALNQDLQEAATLLGAVIGIDATTIVEDREAA